MIEKKELEEWTIKEDERNWIARFRARRSEHGHVPLSRTLLRYFLIVFIAVSLGCAIAYVNNSGLLSPFAVRIELPSLPGGPTDTEAPIVKAPGTYITKKGAFVSTDGVNFERTATDAPPRSDLPTFNKTGAGRWERVR
jgi:hypothetical protein